MSNITWTTQKRKINDLLPYEHNPRKMTEDQVEHLKASLEKFDLVEIPAINTDNTIVAGHQRVRIMQMIGRGEEEVDVRVPSRTLTSDEFKEYLVRSNQNVGMWDFDLLPALFSEEQLLSYGFSPRELDMVEFGDLSSANEKEDIANDLNYKYDLFFLKEEDCDDFILYIQSIHADAKYRGETISVSLLNFLRNSKIKKAEKIIEEDEEEDSDN